MHCSTNDRLTAQASETASESSRVFQFEENDQSVKRG